MSKNKLETLPAEYTVEAAAPRKKKGATAITDKFTDPVSGAKVTVFANGVKRYDPQALAAVASAGRKR